MLLHKSVEHDSRVRRAARALAADGHEVTILHLPRLRGEFDGPLEGYEVASVTPPAWVRDRLPAIAYRLVFLLAFVRAARRLRPDAIHAHDAAMLAPGWVASRMTAAWLVYDSHEYAAGVPYRKRGWALLVRALERLLVGRCAATIAVSDGIADRLWEDYGLRKRPLVVRNLPDPAEHDPDFEAPDLREALGVGAGAPLVLHLGAVARDRGCETLVRAMARLPEAHLLFLGADDLAYAAALRSLARAAGVAERTHFRPSVPVAQIRAHTRQANVGVSLLEDTCENHRLALPNKVFEYAAAGVPVVVADLPELRALAEREGIGTVARSTEPGDVAAALRTALVGDGGDAVQREGPGWAADSELLAALYRRLAGSVASRPALVLVRNPISHDARVLREARLLEQLCHDVRVLGAASSPVTAGEDSVEGVRVRRVHARLPLEPLRRPQRRGAARAGGRAATEGTAPSRRSASRGPRRTLAARAYRALVTLDWYRRAIAEVRRLRPALVHCNDYNTMWVGAAAKALCGSRVVYDSHELWPDRNLRFETRPWLLACEALFVRLADATVTTSPAYARVIARRYRVDAPVVVRNVPDLSPVPPRPRNAGSPLAVYFGALTHGRGLEEAIAALGEVPDLGLRLVGPEAWGFRTVLADLALGLGVADRVELLDPVTPARALDAMREADVGLALIQPVCLSYRLTLPNKLFEYVLAGLPVLATDLPAIGEFVREHGVGVTVPPGDPTALAAGLRAVLDPATGTRLRRAVVAAQPVLSWRHESERLADVYRGLLGGVT